MFYVFVSRKGINAASISSIDNALSVIQASWTRTLIWNNNKKNIFVPKKKENKLAFIGFCCIFTDPHRRYWNSTLIPSWEKCFIELFYISYYLLSFSATMQTQQSNASSVFLKNIQVNTDLFYNWTNWDYIWLNALPLSSFREVMRERTVARFLQKLRILRLIIGKLTWPLLVNVFCFFKSEENKTTNKLAC